MAVRFLFPVMLVLVLVPVCASAAPDCVVRLSFGNESAALSGTSQAVLHELALNHARSKIEVLGNADMVANDPGNAALAQARAAAVRAYLVAQGMAEKQINLDRASDALLAEVGITLLESRRLVLVRIGDCGKASAPRGAVVVVTTTTTTTTTVIPASP